MDNILWLVIIFSIGSLVFNFLCNIVIGRMDIYNLFVFIYLFLLNKDWLVVFLFDKLDVKRCVRSIKGVC